MDIAAPGKIEPGIQTTLPLKIVIVGHVDHGKSTLVGRLFHDTGTLPEGRVEAVRAMCEKRGMPFEWAFLLDALQAERDQGITIDISQIFFRTATAQLRSDRRARTPRVRQEHDHRRGAGGSGGAGDRRARGHAGTDAPARLPASPARHSPDRRRDQQDGYGRVLRVALSAAANRCPRLLRRPRARSAAHAIIPLVARDGDNIVAALHHMRWYEGPTLAEALDQLQPPVTSQDLPLRFPVQDVYKFDDRRIIAGRIESGYLRKGDTLLFSPSNKQARIASIEEWNARQPVMAVRAGESIGVTLDEPIFVERGEIASLESRSADADQRLSRPDILARPATAGARRPLQDEALHRRTSGGSGEDREGDRCQRPRHQRAGSRRSQRHSRGRCCARAERWRSIRSTTTCSLAGSSSSRITTSSAAASSAWTAIADQRQQRVKSTNIFRVEHRVPIEERWKANGHRGGILWMTGLSGAGKSTLAFSLEQHLFRKGYLVYVLDGDNVRHGLCSTSASRRGIASRTSAASARPRSCSPTPAFSC